MRKEFALGTIFLMIVSMLLIPISSKALDYGMNQDLGNVDASFWGENADDWSGGSIAVTGDVNGDGYDDILIGANGDDDAGNHSGQTYLIFGRASGWSMDTNLSNSDASFLGEDSDDGSGASIAGAGDVNGDGYDDILIGAVYDEDGGSRAGQTYLILGKVSGWSMGTDLSDSDASFWGEDQQDYSGISIAGAGDVNGDGYDDILIGAFGDENSGGDYTGQTYLIFGKSSGWAMDTSLSDSDASFLGEDGGDCSGCSVTGAGDVNGDGYDDILIGAYEDESGGLASGQTYLIFGKGSGWAMDTNLSDSDASFWGKGIGSVSGWSVASGGDVNGDEYDDILIGAPGFGQSKGKTYLILGKASGWFMDMDVSTSDISFLGEDQWDSSGGSVAGAGDVNGDGYDDILIGAYRNRNNNYRAGQSYLILGKPSGWVMDTDLSASDASFWGEDAYDWSGYSVAGGGDVNGDGYDDILIGANKNDEGGSDAGQTYLIFPDLNSRPTSITSVKAYSDDEYSQEISYVYAGNKIFLELRANDRNPSRKNVAQVWVKGKSNPNNRFRLRLLESGENTGKFRGEITIANRTHDRYRWINASGWGWVEISSMKDLTILINLSIRPGIYLETRPTIVYLSEDDNYSLHFNTTGEKPESWTLNTNAPWLFWDEFTNSLVGFPFNLHVGTYWVNLHVQGIIYWDEINFTIVVNNTSPEIFLPDRYYVYEDEELFLDLNSTDEGEGSTTWDLDTNADWLSQNSTSGVLFGHPTNHDVGKYNINVSIDDGNDGEDFFNFIFDVLNTPPIITTRNIVEIYQDEVYYNEYNSTDDGQGLISWSLMTNATWLSINSNTGILNGTPTNDDVGIYMVNITVSDGNDGWGYSEFLLRVWNVNDPPILYDGNVTPNNGDTSMNFTFYVHYMDVDNDPPANISLIIGNFWYSMIKDDPKRFNFSDGIRYEYSLNLPEGFHGYYFIATDGNQDCRIPTNEDLLTMYVEYNYNNQTPLDSDGDGWNDTIETQVGTDPRNNLSVPQDIDRDGIPDSLDPDRDGDGVANVDDAYPDDGDRWEAEKIVEERDGTVWWLVIILGAVLMLVVIGGVILVRRKEGTGEEKIEGGAVDELGRVGKDSDG